MKSKRIVILKWVFFSLMIIINAFIIYQSCLPKDSSKSWSQAVIDVINVISDGDIESTDYITPTLSMGTFIRKMIGHFSLFMIDGIFTYLYFFYLDKNKQFSIKYLYLVISVAIGILLAVITESLQLIIPGRAGDVVDALIDIGGYIFGLGVTFLITLLCTRRASDF